MTKPNRTAEMPVEHIAQAILILRGQKVPLDADLAALYGVPTKALNQAREAQQRALSRGFCFPAHT